MPTSTAAACAAIEGHLSLSLNTTEQQAQQYEATCVLHHGA
jgi:hypothetical protein